MDKCSGLVCLYGCKRSPTGGVCDCPTGRVLANDSRTCIGKQCSYLAICSINLYCLFFLFNSVLSLIFLYLLVHFFVALMLFIFFFLFCLMFALLIFIRYLFSICLCTFCLYGLNAYFLRDTVSSCLCFCLHFLC